MERCGICQDPKPLLLPAPGRPEVRVCTTCRDAILKGQSKAKGYGRFMRRKAGRPNLGE